ncbi:MFS transporter [Streptomyces albidoflavus]|uniref:MFS transporter n=1 Tax=Streptomyces sampsonii TaxID=42239 RepID=A0A7G8Z075_9ACTN|nr:MFS transporter [Streptomyces sampsonii]
MSTTETPRAAALPEGPPVSARRAWAVVGIILVGEIMDLLDALVTTVAGPTIMRDMGGSQEFIQWLAAGYTIAMAVGLLIGGRLGDKYGRKNLFLIGLTGFTLTSLVSALATSPETLITARVLQGLLGALMVPQALGIIRSVFPPDKVGLAFGVTGPVMALSGVAGPILAGWLVDADYFGWGWRMIFAVNIPVGVSALVAGLVLLPRSQRQRDLKIDLVGAVMAAAGMGAVIFSLVRGRELGWPWWVGALLLAGVVALAGFVRYQFHRAGRGLPALVVPTLFRKKAFVSGLFVGMLFFSVMMGGALLFSLFFQLGLGMSPLMAGLATIAQAVGMLFGFAFSQALGMARRTMYIGFAVSAAGLLGALGTIAVQSDPVNAWWLSPALAVIGIGSGLAIAPFFDITLSGVDEAETGSASGTLTSAQQVGNALGASVLGTVFFSVLNAHREDGAPAFTTATSTALLVALALVAGAALCTRGLPERAVRHTEV